MTLRAHASSGGLAALGARFATAARARWVAAVATIGVCAGVVTLMLALASLLERPRDDPGTVGKRYQLTVQLDRATLEQVRAVPGVADASPRFVTRLPAIQHRPTIRSGTRPLPKISRKRGWGSHQRSKRACPTSSNR